MENLIKSLALEVSFDSVMGAFIVKLPFTRNSPENIATIRNTLNAPIELIVVNADHSETWIQ